MKRRLTSVPESDLEVKQDSTAASAHDRAAQERDEVADRRDEAADRRDVAARARPEPADELAMEIERQMAARDRAAAALDRYEASLDRLRAQQYLERSYRDELTGALQRMAGRDQLTRAVSRAHRTQEPLTVAFLDVDGLKRVNDNGGHAAGDVLLRGLGDALRHGLRAYDVVVRYGGDEFVCALPDTDISDAVARFDQVRRHLAQSIPGASFTVGVVALADGEELDDIVARADRAMYATRRRSD